MLLEFVRSWVYVRIPLKLLCFPWGPDWVEGAQNPPGGAQYLATSGFYLFEYATITMVYQAVMGRISNNCYDLS